MCFAPKIYGLRNRWQSPFFAPPCVKPRLDFLCFRTSFSGFFRPHTIAENENWTSRALATHTSKARPKSQMASRLRFCEKLDPYGVWVFGAPKGALGADTIREFGAPRIALGRHFRAIYSRERRKTTFLEARKLQKTFWTDDDLGV